MAQVFDLAVVDGPGAYEFERQNIKPTRYGSALHAKNHARAVYMHDGGLEQIDMFIKDHEWFLYSPKSRDQLCEGFNNIIFIKGGENGF